MLHIYCFKIGQNHKIVRQHVIFFGQLRQHVHIHIVRQHVHIHICRVNIFILFFDNKAFTDHIDPVNQIGNSILIDFKFKVSKMQKRNVFALPIRGFLKSLDFLF